MIVWSLCEQHVAPNLIKPPRWPLMVWQSAPEIRFSGSSHCITRATIPSSPHDLRHTCAVVSLNQLLSSKVEMTVALERMRASDGLGIPICHRDTRGRAFPRDRVASGKPIAILGAPTRWGRVDYRLETRGANTLATGVDLPARGALPKEWRVTFRIPAGRNLIGAAVNGHPATFTGPHNDVSVITQAQSVTLMWQRSFPEKTAAGNCRR